ncbi:hypothetical protein VMCG_09833 [Cytospora schulzeri]|uniref:Uncharacterized protein n=1 Tax=Cytospora schulzeri TaxID=448051 RepID=A0A423VHL7_9PEZI|nr:hypothetical protein VMCG_09833 [Valsa malicola]
MRRVLGRPITNIEDSAGELHEEQAQVHQNHLKTEDTDDIVQVKKEETPFFPMEGIPPHNGQWSSIQVKKEESPLVSLEGIPLYQDQESSGRISPRQTKRIDYSELARTGNKMEKKQ